jgi:Macrocin-O-methyltransferase (TylF).
MVTDAMPPWLEHPDSVTRDFSVANSEFISHVRGGAFKLSQFSQVQDIRRRLIELMWRHYVVFWSVNFATRATKLTTKKTLVECGVCDGLTAYFALRAMGSEQQFQAVLYDAWEGMKSDYLLDSEDGLEGSYAFLDFENTRQNLRQFATQVVFVKGFIPDSFRAAPLPDNVIWLHLDLNSSIPTKAALEHLYERMPSGAVILFDDYGWGGYHDTKVAVDDFFRDKGGLLLPLPTGQAIFFKM